MRISQPNIKYLSLSDFALASVPDAALRKDRLYTLRRLQNYFVDYEMGKLVVRKGYTKWNEKALPAPGTQIHIFQAANTERVLVISDNKWYVAHQTTLDPQLIVDETATSPRPILTVEQRCLFCTDTDAYWTDMDQLTGPNAFNLGIEKPTSTSIINSVAPDGNYASWVEPPCVSGINLYDINVVTQKKISSRIIVTRDTLIMSLQARIAFFYALDKSGSIKMRIETDDGGKPSGTLAFDGAETNWIPVQSIYDDHPPSTWGDYVWYSFPFKQSFTLELGTVYHAVIEGDNSYYDNYNAGAGDKFFVAFGYTNATGGFNYSEAHGWSSSPMNYAYYLSGLDDQHIYDYCFTWYNIKYGIESRPSDKRRVKTASAYSTFLISSPQPSDVTVDKIRIYRREFDSDLGMSATDDEITDTYKLVGEINGSALVIPPNIVDSASTSALGAELQTQDHYTIRDTDDTGSGFRESALIPNVWCIWKGRVWFAEKDSNILYMTKKLEEDGATGITGDPIPDFVPLTNKLETGYPYSIIGILPLQSDQMAIYFKNGSVWLLWGCDKPTNPPDDYSLKEMASIQGAIATKAICNVRGSHTFVSRDGIYVFNGNPDPESLSRSIDSLLKEITTANLEKSVLMLYGNELWALLDLNNDGVSDTVYILDLSREVATWRYYEYHDNITDFVVKNSSTSQRTILAVTDTNYIYELEKGQTDNYYPINVMVELHNLRLPSQIMITEISIKANYPGNPQPYVLTLTDHAEETTEYFLNPSSSYDVRGHRTGCRGVSPISLRVKLEQKNILDANELWSINVGYIEK